MRDFGLYCLGFKALELRVWCRPDAETLSHSGDSKRDRALKEGSTSRFPSSPLIKRVPFFLLFGFNKGTQKKKGTRVLLGHLLGGSGDLVSR